MSPAHTKLSPRETSAAGPNAVVPTPETTKLNADIGPLPFASPLSTTMRVTARKVNIAMNRKRGTMRIGTPLSTNQTAITERPTIMPQTAVR